MAFKYFVGLAPEDSTIDPSLLTKFRKTRITEDILEDMLAETIKQAIEKGLIKSKAIIVDSTHTHSKSHSETPTQTLRRLSKNLRKEIYNTQVELSKYFPEKPLETAELQDEIDYTNELVKAIEGKIHTAHAQKLLEKIKELLEDDKIKNIQSQIDEDATVGHKSKDDSFFDYKSHIAMTEERLITGISVTTGKAADCRELTNLVEKTAQNGFDVEEIIGDRAYSSKDNIDYCNENDIKLISRLNTVITNGNIRNEEFVFNKDADTMQCPEGHLASRCEIKQGKYDNKYYNYYFSIKKCRKCPRCGSCYKEGAKTKSYNVTVKGETREKQYEFENTDYFKERIKERYKIEAKNAELKQSHGLRRCKYVGLFGMQMQIYFTAFVANIKRIVKLNELKAV
jgi:IS5 family transposase